MTITEAHHVMRIVRLAVGHPAGTDEQLRESFDYVTTRAGKSLQVSIHIDGHDIDAAIHAQRGAR